LENTIIRAPVTGTVLERNVEKGEFVTTGFVGDRGAKGYVVSLADLNDLQVELDINQNDFARLGARQKGVITTDAYPDRRYDGFIEEISPEANRQKATVQVKVKVSQPDQYLRPDMNASVAFVEEGRAEKPAAAGRPVVYVPPGVIRNDTVYLAVNGRVLKRAVRVGTRNAEGVRIEDGLIGGEDLILNPPAEMKDGDKVRAKGAQS
jgi:HlyD family secretion protein